jgi:S-adenosylmethionine:tRNA ribosyltransferase-isomerase
MRIRGTCSESVRAADFEYHLPPEAIAQTAVEPRHSSRLLDSRDLSDHVFLDLADLLEPGDLVVLNETRVRAARLLGRRRGTGGRVELLILEKTDDGSYEALARPARRLRAGTVIDFGETVGEIIANVGEGLVVVDFETDDPEALFEDIGVVPLPPYFAGELADPVRYQTVYADQTGSAAAPTAGLHFTCQVMDRLERRGISIATIDLHVSLDTFRPMSAESVEDHVIHSEWCSVPAGTSDAIAAAKKAGGRVVAIGTTVVRALEAHADGLGGVVAGSGRTTLFLRPGVPITVPDLMVTNFHLPGSTLLVLLEAFMGPVWRAAYEKALERGYRFLSFGDAMLAQRLGT